jgi:hypothetical protein
MTQHRVFTCLAIQKEKFIAIDHHDNFTTKVIKASTWSIRKGDINSSKMSWPGEQGSTSGNQQGLSGKLGLQGQIQRVVARWTINPIISINKAIYPKREWSST